MLSVAADTLPAFAVTPSGWVTGVGLPIAVVFLGWRLARADHTADQRSSALENRLVHIERTQDAHTTALSVHSASLQVVVTEIAPLKVAASNNAAGIVELKERTSSLRSALDLYLSLQAGHTALPAGPSDVRG